MSYIVINKTKIRKLSIPKTFDITKIQIGVPVLGEEAKIVNLHNVGDLVLPSAELGLACSRNANGYSYIDKTQPKEYRYVSTAWVQPFGNDYASPVPVDQYRMCYPRVSVPPTEIEFLLHEDAQKKQYVMANLTTKIRDEHLLEVINLFLEIYNCCYIFDEEIYIDTTVKRKRCNWELLPPGEKPSKHLTKQLRDKGDNTDTYDVARLRVLDSYNVELIAEGINGFHGYYAYIFKEHCILESAVYGNATYVIPKDNWEVLSQRTKQELLDAKVVIDKIIHKENWRQAIRKRIKELENQ